MKVSRKSAFISKECVACGSCLKVCPMGALSIYKGIYAKADPKKCIGCGKCVPVCPAGIISILERGGEQDEKENAVV